MFTFICRSVNVGFVNFSGDAGDEFTIGGVVLKHGEASLIGRNWWMSPPPGVKTHLFCGVEDATMEVPPACNPAAINLPCYSTRVVGCFLRFDH